ncbi:MAG TPA: hypothetical protein VI434_01375 [Candidatus Dormibacteraeota bacterium]
MAKKTRKQKQRAPARRVQAPGAAPRPAAPAASSPTRVPQTLPATVLPLPGSGAEVESEPDDVAVPAAVAADDAYAAADGSSRRRVQRLNPTAQPRPTSRNVSTAAMFLPLESDDAAIPFDRVPYVPQDLRRVAIMASLMIVLILIAAFVVTRINP